MICGKARAVQSCALYVCEVASIQSPNQLILDESRVPTDTFLEYPGLLSRVTNTEALPCFVKLNVEVERATLATVRHLHTRSQEDVEPACSQHLSSTWSARDCSSATIDADDTATVTQAAPACTSTRYCQLLAV